MASTVATAGLRAAPPALRPAAHLSHSRLPASQLPTISAPCSSAGRSSDAATPALQQQRRRRRRHMAPAPLAAVDDQQQQAQPQVVQLKAVDVTAENFAPYGQLVGPGDDGKVFDQEDAQLDLSAGQPRFYIMRLPRRGRRFERITYHARVTQCLGGLQPASPWFLVVAAPTLSVERHPRQADLAAFRIPHGVYVKLHKGTWHAGPLFDGEGPFDFYNLELSDTNVTDHNTHDYARAEGLAFEVVD